MQKSNLVLHCGASKVDREALAVVPTPAPTETWMPIPHHSLLEQVTGTLERNGLQIVTEAHALTRDGSRYFGLLQVVNGHNSDEFGLVIGLRNSHDKSFPAGLALGASVFVCDNLSFSGEVKLARKHTTMIWRDLPMLTERAVGKLTDLRCKQEQRFLTYKQHEVTDSQAHDLIVQALDAKVVPVTKIPDVIQEWRAPRHPEFKEGGKTLWRLFNAFTESIKGNLTFLPNRTQALHGLLDTTCNLTAKHQMAV